MAEKRGKGRPKGSNVAETVILVPDDAVPDAYLSERLSLRKRWELASVLNFLRVFKPLFESDLRLSADEIETALIAPNDLLAEIHIALLKGIPPVNKNLKGIADAWVKVVYKKLDSWWQWVAEGDNPLKADHGDEEYKELDPTARLLILKALCEVRTQQDDIFRYIADELKKGTSITAFRKEKIGDDNDGSDGITYWYDGDSEVGYRLYREITRVESKQKSKAKGLSTQPAFDTQWETLATNLEEFLEISDKLSSSHTNAEAAVREMVQNEIIPVLEELQKKKERLLKRQQRQALLLNDFQNFSRFESRHSRRERKPVKYTFDEYDQHIEEAIQMSKRPKTIGPHKENSKQVDNGSSHQDLHLDGTTNLDKGRSSPDEVHNSPSDDDKHRGLTEDNEDTEDDDYAEKDDHQAVSEDSNTDDEESEDVDEPEEEEFPPRRLRSTAARNQRKSKSEAVVRLRRSQRTTVVSTDVGAIGHAGTKKRLRERPTKNTDYAIDIVSNSEDENLLEANKTVVSMDVGAKGHAETKKRLRERPTKNTDYSFDIVSNSEDESLLEAKKNSEIVSDSEGVSSSSSTASDEWGEDSGDEGHP